LIYFLFIIFSIDCCAQLRGRGRPPTSTPTTSTPMMKAKSSRGVSQTRSTNSSSSISTDTKRKKSSSSDSTKKTQINLKLINSKKKGGEILFAETIKANLQDAVNKGVKGELLQKSVAVIKFLVDVACCTKSEDMFDSILSIGEMLNSHLLHDSFFKCRAIQTSSKRRINHPIPQYITSLECDGSNMMIQHSINGSSIFKANNNMSLKFMNTKEANLIYLNHGGDPDSVAKQLISVQDRHYYLNALSSMLVNDPKLNSEVSLLLHCNPRNGEEKNGSHNGGTNSSSDRGCEDSISAVLCLCHLRVVISPDGNEFILATKLTVLPTPSKYLVTKPLPQKLTSSSSLVGLMKNTDETSEDEEVRCPEMINTSSLPLYPSVLTATISHDEEDDEEEGEDDDDEDMFVKEKDLEQVSPSVNRSEKKKKSSQQVLPVPSSSSASSSSSSLKKGDIGMIDQFDTWDSIQAPGTHGPINEDFNFSIDESEASLWEIEELSSQVDIPQDPSVLIKTTSASSSPNNQIIKQDGKQDKNIRKKNVLKKNQPKTPIPISCQTDSNHLKRKVSTISTSSNQLNDIQKTKFFEVAANIKYSSSSFYDISSKRHLFSSNVNPFEIHDPLFTPSTLSQFLAECDQTR